MYKKLDSHNRLTLFGIYKENETELKSKLNNIKDRKDDFRKVTYVMFRKVVSLYLTKVYQNLLNGYSFRLYNHFGKLQIVKTLQIRYNPKTYRFYRNEDGTIEKREYKFKSNNGYWYFVFWNCAQIYRYYKFNVAKSFKLKYMKEVSLGMDYLDISLDDYGRSAVSTYKEKNNLR